ncbi:MAG: TonB-dependent receptor, partial [Sphingobacteriales bacterium]
MFKSYTLITFLFCALISAQASAQNILLQGTVKDTDNLPLAGAAITAEGTNYSTTADRDGRYKLKLKPGNYRLSYSFIGFNTVYRAVNTSQPDQNTLNVSMELSSSALQQVEVIGRKEQSYKTTRSFIGKAEADIKDIPQSVSYASKEFIADRGLMRVGDIVRNLSGVTQASFYDDLTIRGFRVNGQVNTQLINGLRTSTGFWKQPLANYLERVEVLKGPSSALFGNASPGGVVNRVTKKPLDETRRSVNFSSGSFNTFRALADFTGPASQDSSLLYRLNLGYENAGSFRDLMFDKNLVIAPSLTFLPSDRTSINFDLVYNDSKSRLDRGQTLFGSADLNSTPQSLSLNTTNDYMNEQTYNVTFSINHKIKDNLSVNAAYMKTGYEEDLYEHRTSGTYGVDRLGAVQNNLAGMMIISRKRKRYIDNLSGYINYKPVTGKVKHNIVAGYDFGSEKLPVGSSQMSAGGYLNKTRDSIIATYIVGDSLKYARDKNGAP